MYILGIGGVFSECFDGLCVHINYITAYTTCFCVAEHQCDVSGGGA